MTIESLILASESMPYHFRHLSLVRANIEELSATADNSYSLIIEAYGANVFKCSVLSCSCFLHGFKTRQKRDEHQLSHEGHFECTHDGCDYAILGFTTPQALVRHLTEHEPPPCEPIFPKVSRCSLTKSLEHAIDKDDEFAVSSLSAEITAPLLRGKTLLMRALKKESLKAAKILLQVLPAEESMDLLNSTMMLAARNGDEDLVKMVIGMNNDKNAKKITAAMLLAASNGYAGIVILFLSQEKHKLDLSRHQKVKLLMDAAGDGHQEWSGALLDNYGPSYCQPNVLPLLNAIEEALLHRHWPVAVLLLKRGRELSPDYIFDTLNDSAQIIIKAKLADMLLKKRNTMTHSTVGKSLWAVSAGDIEVILHLLDGGPIIDAVHDDKFTVLSAAACLGNLSFVQQVLDRGADVNAFDNRALVEAAESGHEAVVKLLLQTGANINAHAIHLKSPLWHAIQYGHDKVLELLLEWKADTDAEINDEFSALQLAVFFNHEKMVGLLLKAGAKCGSRNSHSTPLQQAVMMGSVPIVKSLLDADTTDIDATRPCNSFTPLQLAIDQGLVKVADLLSERGAIIPSPREQHASFTWFSRFN